MADQNGQLHIFKSEKGKNMVSNNGYVYQFHIDGSEKKLWRCCQRGHGCIGRLHTDDAMQEAKEIGAHNHGPNPSFCDVKETMSNIKLAAKSTRDPPALVISSNIATLCPASLAKFPNSDLMKRTIRRTRTCSHASVQNFDHRKDIEIPIELVTTEKGDNFLQCDDASGLASILMKLRNYVDLH
ncbi:uncharacterized protein LOC118437158 [Folsomia candida]|uniref:uncharacterized protein LOC118437158 n=1 Tax=Folsomia candida TaxID=158441 RepID=UPI001604C44F|nr:uncharacterized protein LOC118437158 [Folsomia candida]